jgi:DnaK suppressor protein
VSEGSYGTCDTCGKPIGDARLEALPTAVKCLDCQSGSASRRRQKRR